MPAYQRPRTPLPTQRTPRPYNPPSRMPSAPTGGIPTGPGYTPPTQYEGTVPGRPGGDLLPVIKGFLDQRPGGMSPYYGPIGPGYTPPTGGEVPRSRTSPSSYGPIGPGYTPPTTPVGGVPPRTRPSMYPDVQGFSRTPTGQMLLRNIIQRMMAVKRSGGRARSVGPTPRGPRTEPSGYTQGR